MAIVEKHQHGSPAWLARFSADNTTAREFYRKIFGWTFHSWPSSRDGDYITAQMGGADILAFANRTGGGAPPSWTAYFASDDLDETCREVAARGGEVLVPPTAVERQGRYAIACDREGRQFGVWEAAGHVGSGRVREPGALSWLETTSCDAVGMQEFYGAVFRHTFSDRSSEVGTPYFVVRAAGVPVAGIEIGSDVSTWLPYFAVADAERVVRQVTASNGRVVSSTKDVPGHGKIAHLADVDGYRFAVVERCPGNA